jgi:integrase
LFAVIAFTGKTRLEVQLLNWEDVDLKENVIHIGDDSAKFGKRRSVPVHPFLREVLLSSAANPVDGQDTPMDTLLLLGARTKGPVLWTRDRKSHYAGGKSFEDFGRRHDSDEIL